MASLYDVHWSLFCETSGRQIDGLTYTQAKGVLLSIPPDQRGFWLAWHELISEWKPASDFPELQEDNREKERMSPPVASKATDSHAFKAKPHGKTLDKSEDPTVGLKLEADGEVDKRMNRRFHKRLEVTINIGPKSYQTHTENISLGGMLIAHYIPNTGNEKIMAILSNGTESLAIPCALIAEPSGGKPRRLRFLTDQHNSKLFSWLLK